MNFDEQSSIIEQADEVLTVCAAFSQTFDHPLLPHKATMHDFHTYGPPSRAHSFAFSQYLRARDSTHEGWNKQLDDVITVFEAFVEELHNWKATYEDLSPEERIEQGQQVEIAIGCGLAYPALHARFIHLFTKACPWEVNDENRELLSALQHKFEKLAKMGLDAAMYLINEIGFVGAETGRYMMYYFWLDTCHNDYWGGLSHIPRPNGAPTAIITGDHYKTWFRLLAENDVALFGAVRDGLFGYIHQLLINCVQYLTSLADTPVELSATRSEKMFIIIDWIFPIFDHFTQTCCNATEGIYFAFIPVVGLFTWFVSYCSAFECKEKGLDGHDYDQYCSKLAKYHLWLVQYVGSTSYRGQAISVYENKYKLYDFFPKMIILSKNSIKYLTPVIDALEDAMGSDVPKCIPRTLTSIKPKFVDIAKLPHVPDLGSFKNVLDSQNSKDVPAYFNPKIARALANVGTQEEITSQFGEPKELPDIAPLYAHLNKRQVEPSTVFGKIRYVNNFEDYRVKIVKSNPDLTVKVVKNFEQKQGCWRIINTPGQDFKIKVVSSGVCDFTVKLE